MRFLYFFSCTLALLLYASLRLSAQLPVAVTLQETLSAAQLQQNFPLLSIKYGVKIYKMTYTTPDVFGVRDTASGLLVLPFRAGEQLEFPLLVYQHGTADHRNAVPSNPASTERQLVYALGGLGYVSLAPDYLGLGDSRGFHPYVHAESEATAALDMIRALHTYAAQEEVFLNDQLFITGYSQGGHASMALHRAIEREYADELKVTAAAHLSGPYSISGVMKGLILQDTPYQFPAYLINTLLSFNYVYQLYPTLDAVFKPRFLPAIRRFRQGEASLSATNAALLGELEQAYGRPVVRQLFQDSLLANIVRYPDHPLNRALRANDVYDWAPQAPTRLFFCMADEQVPYHNAIVADSAMRANGASTVAMRDVLSFGTHGNCVYPAALATADFFAQYQRITTSAPELSPLRSGYLYPNPAQREIFLRGLAGPAEVRLIDAQGQVRKSARLSPAEQRLDISGLDTGLYYVQVIQGGRQYIDRLVVY